MAESYTNATICLNGHVVSPTDPDSEPFCDSCGKSTVSHCAKCSTYIRGSHLIRGVPYTAYYSPPSYCYSCGNPFPWTETLINNAVELISLDDNLSNEVKEIIKNAVPNLVVETPTTPLATAKYKKFIPSAAKYVQDGLKNLLIDVASETVKKALWD